MKNSTLKLSLAVAAIIAIGAVASSADAQQVGPVINGQMIGGDPGKGPGIMRYPCPKYNVLSGATDFDHPAPMYAHSRGGIDATRTHYWNGAQATQYSWHGGYYHPQWGQPLALVVPPTASFQTVYNWGVGRTQSVPIYHQYSRENPGSYTTGNAGFHPTPYWPQSTQQFGVYYYRAPW
jgi:hypothetical protein